MIDQTMQGLHIEGRSVTSSTPVESLRAKIALLGDEDPRMLDMVKDKKLDVMSQSQIATIEDHSLAARGIAVGGDRGCDNDAVLSISSDFPDTSVLKYFGRRPEGVCFAR